MDYREYLEIGYKSITQHKLRSFLTMLGVIFGVGAVIAMMSIAGGAQKAALEQIKLLGTNNIRVKQVELSGDQRDEAEFRGSPGLSLRDVDLIPQVVPGVEAVAPIKIFDVEIRYQDQKAPGRVVGTSTQYDEVVNFYPEVGRFISDLDVLEAKKVCILGVDIAQDLFKLSNPIGEKVKIEENWYTVVGVMQTKAIRKDKSTVIEVRNMNRDVYIPISTMFNRLLSFEMYDNMNELAVRINNQDLVIPAAKILERMLLRTHKGIRDFEIVIPRQLLAQAQKTQQIFNVVMGAIAAISLLVGGIGIMNIMLATVTERIKEIGIRRAIGATERDIMLQFLNETVFISVSGGVIGIFMGALMAEVITRYAEWDTVISGIAIVSAFGISVLVGVVFGMYPAQKAARMDPIQALRSE